MPRTKKTAKQKAAAKRYDQLKRADDQKILKRQLYENKKWYTIRSILGNTWASWFFLIGARQRGKTYSVQDYVLNKFFNPKSKLYHVPFFWMRLTDIAVKTMLMNNGAKMFEPLLVKKYHLENIKVRGDTVYINNIKLCYVWGLSTAYNTKGAAIFDCDTFKGANIIVDEIAWEKSQKKTMDPAYNLSLNIEAICRNKYENVKIFMMLNYTSDCPEIMSSVAHFIPIEYGIYKLKRRRCIIDYIENTKAYLEMRSKALANDLDNNGSNFTNKVVRDLELLYKGRLTKPVTIVKFSKDKGDWFTIWEGNIVCPYKDEKKPSVAMKRYINDIFIPEARDNIIAQEDVRAFKYKDLYTQTLWRKNMESIKK